ncbi:MAG TPA: glycosyltransferase family 4 protein [Patescibacteria group bacterium]|nr:glycosyltransferase family 4 protein [Patescibacteria group bacterium]
MQKDTGASVRIYNLAKCLAESGNDVKVVLPRDKATREVIEGVTVLGRRGLIPRAMLQVLKKFIDVGRPTALYFYDFLFAFRIGRFIREADIVQIEQQSSGGLLIPLIKRVWKRPLVVDCHDVFQTLRVRYTTNLRRMLETFLEKLAYENADLVLTVSEDEKKCLISEGFGKCNIEVIPNGADTKLFFKHHVQKEIREKYHLEGFQTVVFVGNLKYFPNREAIQLLSSVIAPRTFDKIKNVKFLVIGRRPPELRQPNLVFTGFVDNISDLLNMADVAVAPLFHGSGTRLKILEYFSCGLPVVSTSVGAEGLDVKDGVNIFVEDDIESFALRIVELLQNENLSAAMGKAARELATSTYDWSQITHKLEFALNRLLSERLVVNSVLNR